jgi:hypothetical protein
MRHLLLPLLLLVGCAPGKETVLSLITSGTGTLSRDGVVFGPSTVSGYTPLENEYSPPGELSISLGASGLNLSMDANAVVAAWAGKRLDELDGKELALGSSLTGAGTISQDGVEAARVVVSYHVLSYGKVDTSSLGDENAQTPPFMALAFTGATMSMPADGMSPSTYGVDGMLSFSINKLTYQGCTSLFDCE